MSESVEKPDWLVPGVEVAAIRGYGQDQRITRVRIKKIAAKTFSIEGSTAQFRISDQSHREPGAWGTRIRIVPLHSEEVREVQDQARYRRLEILAVHAIEAWRRGRSEQNRIAAIEALQALAPEAES
jgi:hypothetical protein